MLFNKTNKSDLLKVAGGFLLGSVGLTMLGSRPAQKAYTHVTAGVFLAKDYVLEKAEVIQAKAGDIASDAKVIVEQYNQEKDNDFNCGSDAVFEGSYNEVEE